MSKQILATQNFVRDNIPEVPEQLQADWNQSDTSAKDYVKNKTHWTEVDADGGVVYHTLDEKFIPKTIARVTDIPEASSVGKDVSGQTFTIDDIERTANTGAEVFNNYDKNIAVGYYSHAEGSNTIARGEYSHAEGYNTRAGNDYGHAEGFYTSANQCAHAEGNMTAAFGNNSHAEGCQTAALQDSAHAEGGNTEASGPHSHAEGHYTKATGARSHAEGYETTASGIASHAEGGSLSADGEYFDPRSINSSLIDGLSEPFEITSSTAMGIQSHAEGTKTLAYGYSSHAEGYQTNAVGAYSHAEGSSTKASEDYSHAEGYDTTASGRASHAEGCGSIASGRYSHAEGFSSVTKSDNSHAEGDCTIASGENQHVQGRINIEDSDNRYAHIVGNGTFDEMGQRLESNAHTLDWEGNAWFSGDVYVGSTSGTNKDEGSKKLATEEFVLNNSSDGGVGKDVSGQTFSILQDGSVVNVVAGDGAEIFNDYSGTNKATGVCSHAEGCAATASGNYSHAEGIYTTAYGASSHAEGHNTTAKGNYSHSEGKSTSAIGECSHTEGYGTTASGQNQHVQGAFNIADTENKYAHIVGNGSVNEETNERLYSNAHTLDWEGNAWYQGDIYVGGTSQDDGDIVVTDNKLFNDMQITYNNTITWDGNTDGRIILYDDAFKVSDTYPYNELADDDGVITNIQATMIIDDVECTVDASQVLMLAAAEVYGAEGYILRSAVTDELIVLAIYEDTEVNGEIIEKGLYFYKTDNSITTSLTVDGFDFVATEKKIKKQYLPDDLSSNSGSGETATEETAGLMSAEDKVFINSIKQFFTGDNNQFVIGGATINFIELDDGTKKLEVTFTE